MGTRVLVIALDSADPPLIAQWCEQGHLPTLQRLRARAQIFSVATPMSSLPGSLWHEVATGISCGKAGHYYFNNQLHSGEAVPRPIAPGEIDAEQYYWVRAARAGLKVASLDMPHAIRAPDISGVQLSEWGLHNRCFGAGSAPDDFLTTVRARYGTYPVPNCEDHACRAEDYASLLRRLKDAVSLKTSLFEDTLRSSAWDLFTGCFSELHCAGHQFWHFLDEGHSRFRSDAPAEFRTAILDLYRLIDQAIARMVTAAGADAQLVLLAAPGIAPYTGGPNILPEVLARLGLASSANTGASRLARQIQREGLALAKPIRTALRTLLGKTLVRTVQGRLGALRQPFTNPATKAGAVFNNRVGGVRLNLRGREPFGIVGRGNEAEALLEDIRLALHELRDPKSGEPIVAQTLTANEAFGYDPHPDIPDLLVVFRTDLGEIEHCVSPRLGQLDVRSDVALAHRSGDHTDEAAIYIAGPRIAPAPSKPHGSVLDLAPTVLDLLGLEPPAPCDGRSLLGPALP
jgi:predicted AlkP superfamily phosphohydrolase/phosphomutase